jgi:CRISPR-associated protein Csd1
MMMQSLMGLYDRLRNDCDDGSPRVGSEGFTVEKVRWVVTIDEAGRTVGLNHFSDSSNSKKGGFRLMAVPAHGDRTSAPKAFFLCDTPAYLFGVPAKKSGKKHALARELHLAVLTGCKDSAARAISGFFSRDDVADDLSDEDRRALEDDQGLAVFRIAGRPGYAHDDPSIAEAWVSYRRQEEMEGAEVGQCSVTGQVGPLAQLFPSVSGVPGAQAAGAKLISYNKDSFTSFGKDQTYNASMSKDAAFRAGSALRYLYRSDANKVRFGDTMVLFWCDSAGKEREEVFLRFAFSGASSDNDDLDSLKQSLLDLRAGRPLSQLDLDARFHILGISPNAGRLAVRFYFVDTLASFTENFGQYLRDIEMVGCKATSIYAFMRQAALLGKDENVPQTVANACMTAMLKGALFPRLLFQSVLSRMRADHGEKHKWDRAERAAIMKGYLVRKARLLKQEIPEERRLTVSLSITNDDPGYLLGRLFACCENAQQGARGSVGSSVVDRYIASASATPARTFPILLRALQNDVSKLRKEKPGLAIKLDKCVASIFALADGDEALPATLTEEQQGCFFIGYYQQREALFLSSAKKETDQESNSDEEE